MNSSAITGELNPLQYVMVSEDKNSEIAVDAVNRNNLGQLVSSVFWVLLGTGLFFLLYALLAREQSTTGTFVSAFFSGGVGVLVAALTLRKLEGFKWILFGVLAAYTLRVIVGVIFFLNVFNGDYFDGNGKYVNKNHDYQWTYDNVMHVEDFVSRKGEWRTEKIFPTHEDKNAHIHTWMGYFMAAGESTHALDLAPFNAFHHAVAGILIVGAALACGYPLRVSLWSGALTAFIPWGFAASYMWRDSVGLAWVVLAVVLLCIGRELGILGTLLLVFPAGFLAWADRSPYIVAVMFIAGMSVLQGRQKSAGFDLLKLSRILIVSTVLVLGVILFWHNIEGFAFAKHQQRQAAGLSSRVMFMPLLMLRAWAGPFPWFVGSQFDLYVLGDYCYHVVQFAVFIILAKNWRSIVSRWNILTYAAAVFWTIGFIAGGVHTAYLAVAFPFLLPLVLNTEDKLWKYVLISLACFLVSNVLYVSLGFVGSGLVLGTTGY